MNSDHFFPSNELLIDDSLSEEVDDLNDETFGGTGAISDDFEFGNQDKFSKIQMKGQPQELPSFFADQEGENFIEEPLEPFDQKTSLEEEFPTSRRNVDDNEEFFFLDQETEANAQLDSQMESMFTLVLDDEVETPKQKQLPSSSIPITKGPEAWNMQDFSPISREANIWSKTSSSPGETIWGSPGSKQMQQYPRNQTPPSKQAVQTTNPLAKFFGPAIVNQAPVHTPPLLKTTGKVLSVEELEAKLRNQPLQEIPVTQPVPRPSQVYNEQRTVPEPIQTVDVGPKVVAQGEQTPPPSDTIAMNIPAKPEVDEQIRSPMLSHEHFPSLQVAQQTKHMTTPPFQLRKNVQQGQDTHGSAPHSSNRGRNDTRGAPYVRPLRYKENKQMMTAEEIDSIIRMQEAQLHNTGSNPFAEDYYYLMKKMQSANQEDLFGLSIHKPLFESTVRPIIKKPGFDALEGVLGRIPSHSVRAPRPLIQLKQEHPLPPLGELDTTNQIPTSSKVIQSLLITIENAFNYLLETEDIDLILRNASSAQHFNVQHLRSKREELTMELFKLLHVHVPSQTSLPERKVNQTFIYPEDDIFMNMSLVKKGKRLITRSLPILFQNQVYAIFFVYMRNLALFVTSTRLELDVETTNKLFHYLVSIINTGSIPQTILTLQTILTAHTNEHLIKTLQSRYGINMVQNILKHGHDLNLSPFSREEQFSPPGTAGFHWHETIISLFQRLNGNFGLLFTSEVGKSPKIWEFFAVLVVNISFEQKKSLLNQLSIYIKSSPMNPTLVAFLQLSGQTA